MNADAFISSRMEATSKAENPEAVFSLSNSLQNRHIFREPCIIWNSDSKWPDPSLLGLAGDGYLAELLLFKHVPGREN